MDSFNELKKEEEQRRAAEQRARGWLKEILPQQAEIYEKFGFIEVSSSLHRGRTYRIHGGEGDFRTSMYLNGKKAARLCMMMLDPEIPPTDRVIAEYYFLTGDEHHYLATANIQNLVPESRAGRLGTICGLPAGGALGGRRAWPPAWTRWVWPCLLLLVTGLAGLLILAWTNYFPGLASRLGEWLPKWGPYVWVVAAALLLVAMVFSYRRGRPGR